MLPLPEPQPGGSLDTLFVRLDEDARRLTLVWLLAALRPIGPYPLLILHGQQGSGKSSIARELRALCDANVAPLRQAPNDERDLGVAVHNNWLLAFDNLRSIPRWLSDGLCRVATEGAYAMHTLYENLGETVISAWRPVLLNGIDELASEPDLLDRCQ